MSTYWIFRETRSGSTWFTHHVANFLQYDHCFLDKFTIGSSSLEMDETAIFNLIKQYPSNTVFSTHFFPMLRFMDRFEDPIIIRCARRNITEQFLSHCLAQYTNYSFTNINSDADIEEFNKLVQNEILVLKKDLINYMRVKKHEQMLWDEYANQYKNFTVYYEDLCENGVDIPLLNLYNCKIEETGHTKKLPDYKSKVFLNYDMVQKWIKDI